MCSNYIPARPDQLRQYFDVEDVPADFRPEIYPGHLAPIVRLAEDGSGARECVNACFGLVPQWADLKLARHTYNARTETVAAKPSFRQAFARRQFCIIPAASFFEPNYESGKAVRWQLSEADDAPLGLAGIWEWRLNGGEDDRPLVSFSMLTINADDHPLMKRFHRPQEEKRMVVALRPEEYQGWLSASTNEAPHYWRPFPAQRFKAAPAPRPVKATARTRAVPRSVTASLWNPSGEE